MANDVEPGGRGERGENKGNCTYVEEGTSSNTKQKKPKQCVTHKNGFKFKNVLQILCEENTQ